MANRYWVGGTGTWSTTATANWSAAPAITFSGSITGTALTTTGSPALVIGMTIWLSSTGATNGTITGGSGNSWTVSVTGPVASQAMVAATIGASVPTVADSVFFADGGVGSNYTVTMTGALACLDLSNSGFGTFITFASTGTLTIAGSLALTGFVIWNATGTITFTATTSKTINTFGNGSYVTLPAITFNGVGGSWSLSSNLTTVNTATTTLTNGTINLNGFDLTTGIFSSQNANTRAITFGSNFIYLVHPTAAQTVLNIGNTGMTCTGAGGFSTAMTVTRTFTATTTPTITEGVSLFLTSGTSAATFTASSWFILLNFTGYAGTASGTIFAKNLTLSSGGTYTGIVLTTYGTGSLNANGSTTGIGALTIGVANPNPTVTTLATNFNCTTYTQTVTTTTFNINGFTLTCSSTASYNAGTVGALTLNSGTINCTTFSTGDSFTLTNGTINPSVSFIANNGAPSATFTYNGGTLSSVIAFIQQNGTVVLNQNLTLAQTATYTFSQVAASGVLTLNNVTLSTGGFSRTVSGANTINFGTSGQILLTGNNMTVWNVTTALITTTGTVSVSSTYTGSVGTRTFNFYSVPQFNIAIGTGTGSTMYLASGATDTVTFTSSVYNFDMTDMTFTLLMGSMTQFGSTFIIPATGGTVSASANAVLFSNDTTFTTTTNITINRTVDFPLTFNGPGGRYVLNSNVTIGSTRASQLQQGTLNLNGYKLSTGTFVGTLANARTIAFGTTGQIDVTGTGTVWNTGTITLLTITGIPVVNVTSTGSTAITVASGALPEAQAISFNFTGGTYALTFLGTSGYTAKNVDFTGFAGSWTLSTDNTIYGNWKYSTGMTVTTAPNSLVFGATIGNTQTMTSNGKTTNTIKLTGGGIVGLADPLILSSDILVEAGTFNSNNYNISTVRISSYTTTTTRAINLGSSIVTMSGLFRVNTIGLTFNAGTSTIAYTGTNSLTVENGSVIGLTFYNFTNTTMGPSNIGITGKNTFNNLTLPTSTSTAAIYTFADDIIVNGNLTIPTPQSNANDDNKLVVASATIGNQVKITVNGQISSLTKIFFRDINAQGTWLPWVGDRLGNISNNNNISFTPGRNKYWSLAGGGNATQVAWALTSGGTPAAANYPLPQDTVIIDNNGLNTSATITFNSAIYFTSINMASRTNAFTLNISNGENVYVSGDWTNGSGLTSVTNVGGKINFNNSLPGYVQSITSAGKLFSSQIYINTAGIVQLLDNFDQDSLVGVQGFELTKGTLTLNGFNLNTAQFNSSFTNVRTINFGSGFINVTHPTAGTSVIAMSDATNFSATGTGGFRANMSVTRTFNCGSGGAPTVAPNLFIFTGASIPTITSNSYFNTLDFTGSTCSPATSTVNVVNATLATGVGVFTGLTLNCSGSGTITTNAKTIAAVTLLSGSPQISGTCTCTTFTVNGGTLTAWGGTIAPTGSFIVTTGNVYLSNGGTLTVTTITQNGGGVYLTASFTMTAGTSTYTFNAGTLSIYNTGSNQILSVGRFISNGTGVRFLQLYGFIRLTNATAAALAVDMANTTNLVVDYGTFYSPAAGFLTVGTVAQTYTIGTTGGSVNNAISITWDAGGTAIPTITTGSWFANFNPSSAGAFTIAATTINIANSVTLSSAGTWTNCSFNLRGSGTFNSNTKSCATLTLNSVGAYSLAGAAILCVTYQQTAGSLFCGNSLTCSGTATFSGGSFGISNGTLACTTFTVNGGNHVWAGGNGTLTASVGIVISGGSFTYSTGTITATPAWTHNAGSVTFANSYALTATATYTFIIGTIILNPGVTLTVGIFLSTATNTRNIQFGDSVTAGNISLAHTTAGTTVLSMSSVGGFTWSGAGGFVSAMTIARTFSAGSAVTATATNVPPLTITGGSAVITFTFPSYWSRLNLNAFAGVGAAAIQGGAQSVTGDVVVGASGSYVPGFDFFAGNNTLTTNGKIMGSLTISGGNTTLKDAYTGSATSGLSLTGGNLYTQGFPMTFNTFGGTGANVRGIFGTGQIINITGSGLNQPSQFSGSNLTVSGLILNYSNASAKFVSVGNVGNLTFDSTINIGAGQLTITGNSTATFNNITNSVQPCTLTIATGLGTPTFLNFNLRGTAGNLVTINSNTAGTRATIRKASGTVYGDYLSIQDINATGVTGQNDSAPTWYAGANSTNVSNNSGWIFTRLPIVTIGNVFIDASQGGITIGNQPV